LLAPVSRALLLMMKMREYEKIGRVCYALSRRLMLSRPRHDNARFRRHAVIFAPLCRFTALLMAIRLAI